MGNHKAVLDILKKAIDLLTYEGKKRVWDSYMSQEGTTTEKKIRSSPNKILTGEDLIHPIDPETFTFTEIIDKVMQKVFNGIQKGRTRFFMRARNIDRGYVFLTEKMAIEGKALGGNLFEKTKDGCIIQIMIAIESTKALAFYNLFVATDGIIYIFVNKQQQIYEIIDIRKKEDFIRLEKLITGETKIRKSKEIEITKNYYKEIREILFTDDECLERSISFCNNKDLRDLCMIILGQVIFIKILQMKKIIDADTLSYLCDQEDYNLNAQFSQLRFDVFNTRKEKRFDIHNKLSDYPFLNSSLFKISDIEKNNPKYKIKSATLRVLINTIDIHTVNINIIGYLFEKLMGEPERQKMASHYTPYPFPNHLAEIPISLIVIEKINEYFDGKIIINNVDDLFSNRNITNGQLRYILHNIILGDIKFLDKACGSSSLLLACVDYLFYIGKKCRDRLKLGMTDYEIKKTLLHSIRGIDINPVALFFSRLRCWIWMIESWDGDSILPNIDYYFRKGSAIEGYYYNDIKKYYEDCIILNISDNTLGYFSSSIDCKKETIRSLVNQLIELKDEYSATESDKSEEIIKKIEDIENKIKKFLDERKYDTLVGKQIIRDKKDFEELCVVHPGLIFCEIENFDLTVENPPHGDKFNAVEKVLLRKKYSKLSKKETSQIFLYLALEKARENNRISIILPKGVGYYNSWSYLREKILNENFVESILDLGIGFVGVNGEQLALIIKKPSERDIHKIERNMTAIYKSEPLKKAAHNKKIRFLCQNSQKIMRKENVLHFTDISDNQKWLINKMRDASDYFGRHYVKSLRGLPENKVKTSKHGKFKYISQESGMGKSYIGKYEHCELLCSKNKIEDLRQKKLIFKVLRGKRITVFADIDGHWISKDNPVNVLLNNSTIESLLSYNLLLNSSIVSFYVQKMIFSDTTESARHMDGVYLDKILVPLSLKRYINLLAELEKYDIFLNKTGKQRKKEENNIKFFRDVCDYVCYEIFMKENKIIDIALECIQPIDMVSDEEKLRIVKDFIENFRTEDIKKEIEKMKTLIIR